MFYGLDPNGEEPGEARVAEETDERVVIALSSFEPARLIKTRIGGFRPRHADVELRRLVGARVVIDASAGVVRPSLARLGVPAGPPLRLNRVPRRESPAPIRRRGQVWFRATDDDAVYEAMLATDPPRDEDGDPVVMPAVRRDVLEAICRDLAEARYGWGEGLSLTWVDDVLIMKRRAEQDHAFAPGPDGLYEVRRLGYGGRSQWVEVEPPLPDGPIDAEMAVDLLSRVRKRHPIQGLILARLDIDVLRAAHARPTDEAIRDALGDEIAERTHGKGAMLVGVFLRRLERGSDEGPGYNAGYLVDLIAGVGCEEILGLVPDAGERVLALARAEREPDARGWLASALGRLGYRPAIPVLLARLNDPYRHVRARAAWALGALRAGEAASALRRALATERERREPRPPDELMPVPTDDAAEAELRAALLAVTEGRYEANIAAIEPYPWVSDDR